MSKNVITLVIPIYSSPSLFVRQLEAIGNYPPEIKVVIVDDGSPRPFVNPNWPDVSLYRVDADIPWNNHGARNLGAHVAETEWLLMTDADHVLSARCARLILRQKLDPGLWYAIEREKITPEGTTRIHPAPNIFLITKQRFWELGGYDEDYCGSYGGDNVFKALMGRNYQALPPDIYLEVRDGFKDMPTHNLSRDTTQAREMFARKGVVKAENPIRFPWHQVR